MCVISVVLVLTVLQLEFCIYIYDLASGCLHLHACFWFFSYFNLQYNNYTIMYIIIIALYIVPLHHHDQLSWILMVYVEKRCLSRKFIFSKEFLISFYYLWAEWLNTSNWGALFHRLIARLVKRRVLWYISLSCTAVWSWVLNARHRGSKSWIRYANGCSVTSYYTDLHDLHTYPCTATWQTTKDVIDLSKWIHG